MSDFSLVKALCAEFLGTFTLVLIGAMAVANGESLVGSAFAFGLVLMSLYYAWGSFSGAHFNPAVSFGFAVAGRMPWGLMLGYFLAQFLGGLAAAGLVLYFYGSANNAGASIGSLTNTDGWKAFLVEAFLTFFLVMAYLLVTRNPMLAIASGLAIGLVLTFDMLAGAPLTGASMNPARSLGPAIFSNNMGSYWIYIIGPLVGALVAALVYKLFTTDFSCCDRVDECGNPITDECGNRLKECQRPVIDNCGRPVVDCDGCPVMETYTKHERKLGFMQENFMTAIGQWMSSHGFNPMYIKQEFDRAVQKAVPDGVVQDPQSLIRAGVNRAVPAVQTRGAELMSTGDLAAGRYGNFNQDVVSSLGGSPLGGSPFSGSSSGISTLQPLDRLGGSALSGLGAPAALSSLAPGY